MGKNAEQPILEISKLNHRFGGLSALENFDLRMNRGELVGLIGPNGAGKTTVFNLLTGIYRPTSGSMVFRGRDITGMAPHKIVASGIARTFQNIRLFKEFTVLDNVRVGRHHRFTHSVLHAILRLRHHRMEERMHLDRALEILGLMYLGERKGYLSKALPYGDQRRLEIARALAAEPDLLLLDEPAAGLNPSESQKLMAQIRRLNSEFNITILLIEHDMKFVMAVCERIVVLDHGRIIAVGAPQEIRSNPDVIEAYLGPELEDAVGH